MTPRLQKKIYIIKNLIKSPNIFFKHNINKSYFIKYEQINLKSYYFCFCYPTIDARS